MMNKLAEHLAGFVALVMLGCVLTSCGGGGGGGGGGNTPPRNSLSIISPTDSGTYQTEGTSVSLEGSSFVPAGAYCNGIVGTMPAGYQVTAHNAANGASAYTSFYLGCFLQVHVIWRTAPIPLELGSNSITVTASDSSGNTARDTIVVTRTPDTTPPTVVSTSPIAGASGVDVKAAATATFSEPMSAATITSSTFILKDGSNNTVAASVAYDALAYQAKLRPSAQLAFNQTYTATVTTGVRDASGNALAADHVFSFTTAASTDNTAPVVQSVSPASGSTCAATSGSVTASFDEDIDPATVNGSSFGLTGPGSSTVSGTVAYNSRTASFTPASALASNTVYTAALTTAITDLAGNHLAASYPWSFTTSAASGIGSWLPTSLVGVPSARYGHVAVWTGSEMIIASGIAWNSDLGRFEYTSQYGRYNPATETWTVATGAPERWYQTAAIWTGSRMLVWGGSWSGSNIAGGNSYDPGADTWTSMATAGQPTPRTNHTAVWTGSEMIVWGGTNNGAVYGDGARYNPATNTWEAISTTNAPSARYYHTAVWTGTEMIVWGGVGANAYMLADGARYNPSTNTWTPISSSGAPSARSGHVAAWSGAINHKMFIWGEMYGNTNTGGLYDPDTNSWTATDVLCAPSGRWLENAVWTGSRIIIWGGATLGAVLDDGYEYDPSGNTWSKITTTAAPSARSGHTAIWTGSKVIYWGWSDGTVLNTGGVLTP
jgi:N-acetylneuraminic acid mutarotase